VKQHAGHNVGLLLLSLLLVWTPVPPVGAFDLQRTGDGEIGRQNTWAARSSTGLTLNGTWTGRTDAKTGAAFGSWTLLDPNGKVTMRGGWSAAKIARGWSGTWRAAAAGSPAEYSGTWSASVELKPNAPFADLFAMAAQKIVSGNWRAGTNAGSWSIRAFSSQ